MIDKVPEFPSSSLPRRRGSRFFLSFRNRASVKGARPQSGIPAFAGMTKFSR
jgi:hypothetical protein